MTDQRAKMRKANAKRLGLVGYCRILSGVARKARTTAELAEAFGVHHSTMAHVLRSMYRMQLVHRAAWVRPKANSVLVPVWGFGADGDTDSDVPAPRATSRPARTNAITIASIRDVLESGSASMTEIAEEMKMHRETCIRIVRIMRAHGLIRIAEWRPRNQHGGTPTPHYAYGRGRNAPKPAPIGRSPERARKHSADYYIRHRWMSMMHAMANPVTEAAI